MNYIWIDKQYVIKVSSRLRNFKYKSNSPYKVNFSCPYCGDSKINKLKARAWISEYENYLNFKCFNCDVSTSFNNFLKWFDPLLYKEFRFEYIKENKPKEKSIDLDKFKSKEISFFNPLKKIHNLLDLENDHIAVQYFNSRKIPKKYLNLFFYAPEFVSWINLVKKEKIKMIEEPRLVIPLYDENNKVFAISARSFIKNSSLRYITIKFEDKPKIYGLERINFNKTINIVEGNIDSLFLDNCLAFVGASGPINNNMLKDKDLRLIFDNEPRNKEICARYLKSINDDYKIVIWPKWIKKFGKDINDYILAGINSEELTEIIELNTYSGLKALIMFKQWSHFS